MDLLQNFEKLSINEKHAFLCKHSESLTGSWAQLSVAKVDGNNFAVGDYIEVVGTSRATVSFFRIKSVAINTKCQSTVIISDNSGALFQLDDGESAFIRKVTPAKILFSPRCVVFGETTSANAGLFQLCKQHEIFQHEQVLPSGHKMLFVPKSSQNFLLFSIGARTIISSSVETPSVSDQVPSNGPRTWIMNSKMSINNMIEKTESVMYIMPGDDFAKVENVICKTLNQSTSLTVIDCSGRSKEKEATRLILKYDFATLDMSNSSVEVLRPKINSDSWGKIGGYDALIGEVKTHVEALLKINSESSDSDLSLAVPKGILLYGPPGCSKTMIARAIASGMGIEFISVKGPEIFSKWVGDSEKAISEVFGKARKLAPCVIFFDEFDSLGSSRSSEHKSAVESRVVAQLLSEMDGISGGSKIIVIAATNRPDVIDPALLRPGRFDLHFHVPLPDDNSRRKIIELNLSKTKLVEDSSIISQLVAMSEGCSGAEISNGCRQILMSIIKGGDISSELSPSLFKRVT